MTQIAHQQVRAVQSETTAKLRQQGSNLLKGLTAEDKVDFVDVLAAFISAETDDEVKACVKAMTEILLTPQEDLTISEPLRLPENEAEDRDFGPGEWKKFVSARVRQMRGERDWTQKQLAKKSGISQSHISRIEGQSLSPNRKTITKLAKAFGVEISDFDPTE